MLRFPFALFFCLFATVGFATDDLDHIGFEGVVKDSNQNAIVNAKVFVKHSASNSERNTTTNKEGRYRLTLLPPGRYELRIEAAGFQSVKLGNLDVPAGTTLRRDFLLSPATIAEQIVINAETSQPLVDTSRTVVGGTVTQKQIDALPVESRNPLDLIFTLAGTAPPALSEKDLAEGDRSDNFRRTPEESGVFSLTGGTPFSNNLTIEGLDNNDDRAARERFSASHARR